MLKLMTDIGQDDDDAAEWNSSDDVCIFFKVTGHDTNSYRWNPRRAISTTLPESNVWIGWLTNLGGATILAPTFSWLPRMMLSDAWRDRHAALMAISAISEGCRDLMVGELDKVLDLVVPALRDPHSRVRWAGCNALGQMSTDFAGTMQEKYHAVVGTSHYSSAQLTGTTSPSTRGCSAGQLL